MYLPRRPHPNVCTRRVLAAVVAFAQVVAATGVPVLTSAKTGAVAYPCAGHACGCTTPEKGWAGDCCCFTLEQKLAWADAHGIEPPSHVRPLVEARARKVAAPASCCAKPKKKSCCEASEPAGAECTAEPPAPRVAWVAGVRAQTCRGDGPAGFLELGAAVAPELPPVRARPRRSARDFGTPSDCHAVAVPFRPPTPPPRMS